MGRKKLSELKTVEPPPVSIDPDIVTMSVTSAKPEDCTNIFGSWKNRYTKFQLIELAEKYGTKTKVAQALGVSRQAVRRWAKKWPELEEAFELEYVEIKEVAQEKFKDFLQNSDYPGLQLRAVLFALSTLDKEHYSQRVEHVGSKNKEIIIQYVNDWRDAGRSLPEPKEEETPDEMIEMDEWDIPE